MAINSIIVLGKGNSINKISKDEINSHEIIAWCNVHNDLDCDNIPNRADYLYLRDKSFVNDLSDRYKNHLTELKIKKIFCTNKVHFNKILNYDVNNDVLFTKQYKFNPSTGLLAFIHVVSLKPKKITLVGLDLFENNTPIYYHDLDKSLTSKKNLLGLKKLCKNNIINNLNIHDNNKTIKIINDQIRTNENIEFTIITDNINFYNKIKENKNVKQ